MINTNNILETISMIRQENLDIRTITMGISLYDCVSEDENRLCEKIYDKITKSAENLVSVGNDIEKKYGIPIVNKRVSVTPVSLVGGAISPDGYMKVAKPRSWLRKIRSLLWSVTSAPTPLVLPWTTCTSRAFPWSTASAAFPICTTPSVTS